MIMLWNDPTIHAVLEYQKLRLQDLPGLYETNSFIAGKGPFF